MGRFRHCRHRGNRGNPSNSGSKAAFRDSRAQSICRCGLPEREKTVARSESRQQSVLTYWRCVRASLSTSVGKIEAKEKATARQIAAADGSGASLPLNRVFGVKRKTCSTGNEWVVAKTAGHRVDVPEVSRV